MKQTMKRVVVIIVLGVLAFVIGGGIAYQKSILSSVTGGALVPITSEWEYEHVYHVPGKDFSFPYPISVPQISYRDLDRAVLDSLATEVLQDEYIVEEDFDGEYSLSYQASNSDQRFLVYRSNAPENLDVVRFEWYLRDWPKKENGSPKNLEKGNCEEMQQVIGEVLAENEFLSRGYTTHINTYTKSSEKCSSPRVELHLNDKTLVKAHEFTFDGETPIRVSGLLIDSITLEETDAYGTLEEIIADWDVRPYFSNAWQAAEKGIDIDVIRRVTDYYIDQDGPHLYTGIKNHTEVNAAFKAVGLGEPGRQRRWIQVSTSEQRAESNVSYEAYIEEFQ